MRSLQRAGLLGGLILLAGSVAARAQEKAAGPIPARATIAAHEKLGGFSGTLAHITDQGFWYSIGLPPTHDSVPAFSYVREPEGDLPDAGVPFCLHFAHGALTGARLKQLAGLKNLVALEADGFAVTDATLKDVARIRKLRVLVLENSQLTGAGLKELATLPDFSVLGLNIPRVTDAGLRELAALKKLTVLGLSSPRVTAAGLKELANVKSLRTLILPAHLVTDANLRALREAGLLHRLYQAAGKGEQRPNSPADVRTLRLGYAHVTDAGLKELAPFRNLTFLDLTEVKVTDAGLKELAGFKKLSTLGLYRTRVTDAGLKELEPLQNLTDLNLRDTRVTAAGLLYLREALPKCRAAR
jgi:hypothetical protein